MVGEDIGDHLLGGLREAEADGVADDEEAHRVELDALDMQFEVVTVGRLKGANVAVQMDEQESELEVVGARLEAVLEQLNGQQQRCQLPASRVMFVQCDAEEQHEVVGGMTISLGNVEGQFVEIEISVEKRCQLLDVAAVVVIVVNHRLQHDLGLQSGQLMAELVDQTSFRACICVCIKADQRMGEQLFMASSDGSAPG